MSKVRAEVLESGSTVRFFCNEFDDEPTAVAKKLEDGGYEMILEGERIKEGFKDVCSMKRFLSDFVWE